MSRFYITTPIYYVNAVPHLGTFYSTVVDDALARYHRARDGKENVFFLTGLDEHGQKIERIAREKGMEPQAYCDGIAEKFKETWKRVGITNDDFIRTTEPRHKAAVAEMWKRLVDAGDIYEAEYEGMYCVGCESAKTEDEVVLIDGQKVCPIHERPVERVKEKNYFFRLSKYAPKLLEWYAQTPSPVQPESRRNEVRAFVEGGLRDISVSRLAAAVKWGIPVPGDPTHLVYVWIDALTNYLTVLGGPDAVARGTGKAAFWADAHHMIAKDILRFHAVYWPAMLWSAGLPAPKKVFCHGYLTVKGQKISKSSDGHEDRPERDRRRAGRRSAALLRAARVHARRRRRLHLRGAVPALRVRPRQRPRQPAEPHDLDGAQVRRREGRRLQIRTRTDRSPQKQEAGTRVGGVRPVPSARSDLEDRPRGKPLHRRAEALDAGEVARRLCRRCTACSGDCCETLRWAALMVAPAMPSAAREILRQLGREQDEGTWPDKWGWPGGDADRTETGVPAHRARTPGGADRQVDGGPGRRAGAGRGARGRGAAPSPPRADIAYDDFQKLDLRVAKVTAAERVPEGRQAAEADARCWRRPTHGRLRNRPRLRARGDGRKTVIYLANLAPRKIRGVVSQGMILAAGGDEVLALRRPGPGRPARDTCPLAAPASSLRSVRLAKTRIFPLC